MTLEGHDRVVPSISYSPDGKQIVGGAWDNTTRRWDLQAGEEIEDVRDLCDHDRVVQSISFSPDGKQMTSVAWDSIIRRWDLQTGKEIEDTLGAPFEGHTKAIRGLALSFDGALLASTSNDNTIKLWTFKLQVPPASCLIPHSETLHYYSLT
ncbi:prolyl oligopeptidase [Rhizopogon salebrosus TDB-379]|nr:prolyl oligopeptidase [Rhizopogon salebrosus TDB-379]